ncbi:MAG: DUF1015 domain-containing protein [Deltaproteobacteria bacterium]|nr:DUF1015 domain-containing protein [Deltaproteobacteria bacterium]
MVDLSPFRAIRYAGEDVAPLLAPPYDVIDAAEQDRLYARHPHNIVRIDLNRAEDADHPLARYERAAGFLSEWLAQGVLLRDPTPAIYVLAQTFTGPDGVDRTRTGFFARVRLCRFDEGWILPHERTLRGPKADRLHLFRATKTNLSPIFGAYRDPGGEVRGLLHAASARAPLYEATLGAVKNRLYRLDAEGALQRMSELFAPKKIYIADGHHRYETGLAYRDERRAAQGGRIDPDAGFEHILMFSAAVEDPGMVIFPTHRLLHGLPTIDLAQFLGSLSRFFSVEAAPAEAGAARLALERAGRDASALLMVTPRGHYLLRAIEGAPWHEIAALPSTEALRHLDVTRLHAVILETLLGVSPEAQATQANLRYSKDFAEAFAAPEHDPGVQMAFLMNPTKIDEVISVAESGQVMPQKSTFFYPKIPSGLVLYPLD